MSMESSRFCVNEMSMFWIDKPQTLGKQLEGLLDPNLSFPLHQRTNRQIYIATMKEQQPLSELVLPIVQGVHRTRMQS